MFPTTHASNDIGSLLRLMPQAPAPSPHGSPRRLAAPHDDADAGPGGEGRAPHRDQTAPTHTVVFFPPVLGGNKPRPGRGLVLDKKWAVTSKFTAGTSVDMIGACGGLLCLLDVRRGAVQVSNPVTGESLDLPPPPCTSTRHDPRAYCLGFDATTRRHKIVHLPSDYKSASSASTGKGVVYVLRVGGKYWRPVRAPGAACCLSTGGTVYGDGAVYWLTHYKVAMTRLVRFDLSEEVITSVELPPFDGQQRPLYCRLMDADARPCVITSPRHDPTSGKPFDASNDNMGMWRLGEDGRWARPCVVQLRRLLRHVPGPHAVHREHLLLQGEDGALYAHRIKGSGVTRVEHAGEKVLVEGSSRCRGGAKTPADAAAPCRGGGDRARVKRESVVPIMGIIALPCYRDRLKKSDGERVDHHGEKARADSPACGGGRDVVRTFGYVEPVSTVPLA
ncbi:uncharacterized protein LOC133901656 [Phragmites australis]|uniref:uncharacterized protein LOC133901656 n=1 Tax=Phragmites australis TaxID=29695 RepID=UPI002D77A489|nr:uncharacterized protein LOC133901656 [Phragmites australis]